MRSKAILLAMSSLVMINESSSGAYASTFTEMQISPATCSVCRKYRSIIDPLVQTIHAHKAQLINLKSQIDEGHTKLRALPSPRFYERVNAEMKQNSQKGLRAVWEELAAQHPEEVVESERLCVLKEPYQVRNGILNHELFFVVKKKEKDLDALYKYTTQYKYHKNLWHSSPVSQQRRISF